MGLLVVICVFIALLVYFVYPPMKKGERSPLYARHLLLASIMSAGRVDWDIRCFLVQSISAMTTY